MAGTTDMFMVTNVTLGEEPNEPLDYATGLELRLPIMSKLGEPGGRLDIDRDSPYLSPHPHVEGGEKVS